MSDAVAIEAWAPGFQTWKEFAIPLLGKGKAKEAFGQYPWFTTTGDPFVRLSKSVRDARFGLVTTGGYSIDGDQEPVRVFPSFDDSAPEIRMIPIGVDRSKLRIDHAGYDHRFAKQDINVNLPLDRLTELVQSGDIGSLTSEVPVLMGLQPNVGPLIRETIPELVARFAEDKVEAALLVPS